MSSEVEQITSPPSKEEVSFFRRMPRSFDKVPISDTDEISTEPFLEACSSIVPIFDLLGPTLFSPVKTDIEGNINKLTKKYKLDPSMFKTLQQMLLQEIQQPDACQVNNACDSLLWLKRALEFIYEFFYEFLNGNPSLSDGAHKAYSKTLKQFHGYLVRGIFSLVVRAVPSRPSFASMLIPLSDGMTVEEQDTEITKDWKESLNALQRILTILNSFYKQHEIDSDYVV